MDTLCVPKEPQGLRAQAIAGMRNAYQEAEKILALNGDMRLFEYSPVCYEEAFLRLNISRWMRRLWTLHEGVLTRDLYFQFAKGAVSANDLIDQELDDPLDKDRNSQRFCKQGV